MKKIFGYCLFGIFLLCIIHILFLKCGFYYRIMGPSVILNGLEDYYSEEFVITNSEVVKNKKFGADYVSAVDYYISPVSSYSSDDVKRVEDFIAEYSSASGGEN